jgi:hypothetical protein
VDQGLIHTPAHCPAATAASTPAYNMEYWRDGELQHLLATSSIYMQQHPWCQDLKQWTSNQKLKVLDPQPVTLNIHMQFTQAVKDLLWVSSQQPRLPWGKTPESLLHGRVYRKVLFSLHHVSRGTPEAAPAWWAPHLFHGLLQHRPQRRGLFRKCSLGGPGHRWARPQVSDHLLE